VTIPSGALASTVTVSINEAQSGYPSLPPGQALASAVYAFEPHGQSFARDVQITIPFAAADAGELHTFNAEPGSAWSTVSQVTYKGGFAQITTNHFSFYAVVRDTEVEGVGGSGRGGEPGNAAGGVPVGEAGASGGVAPVSGGAAAEGGVDSAAGAVGVVGGAGGEQSCGTPSANAPVGTSGVQAQPKGIATLSHGGGGADYTTTLQIRFSKSDECGYVAAGLYQEKDPYSGSAITVHAATPEPAVAPGSWGGDVYTPNLSDIVSSDPCTGQSSAGGYAKGETWVITEINATHVAGSHTIPGAPATTTYFDVPICEAAPFCGCVP
jgi:hypothetical protein